ncbi:hypothetical protein CHH58_15825 [Terribacillus saccharophilus]|uniref:ATP-binding protein n=1 Tax=Terribacillus saccharophilus TaxID=361277 RepID=UPI000BA5A580|nr:AAA family ATPase [Terribacillus saccharophilus]PAF35683.1 hypothetical protein CHH58_15825 [Terribacillus saccharophilus]
MSKYKIGRVFIQNFKHIDILNLDFSNKDLVVLDGPNGFGKTTVFDAIEIILTGKISRIKNTADKRYGYNEILFANKKDMDTEIKVEFISEKENFVISKRIDSNKKLRSTDRKPDNWAIFQTFALPSFSSEIEAGIEIEQSEISTKLSSSNLKRYFSLFYYVQQEENTFFLKHSAKERMDEISQLFDTYKEEKELEKLNKIKSNIESEIKTIERPQGILERNQDKLNLLKEGVKDLNTDNLRSVEYFSLLPNHETQEEWDKKDIVVKKDSREKFIKDLRELYTLVRDIEDFSHTEFNNKLDRYSENIGLLRNTINAYSNLDKVDMIKKLKEKERQLKVMQNDLSKEKLSNKIQLSLFTELNSLVDFDFDIDDIEKYINDLKSHKDSMGEMSDLVRNLNETRETLVDHFNKIKEKNTDKECPLCGSSYESYESLISSISSKTQYFLSLYDDSTQKYDQLYNELYAKHIVNILERIDIYLSDNKNIVSDNFFDQFTEAVQQKDDILSFMKWCEEHHIDISTYLNSNTVDIEDINSRVSEVKESLIAHKKNVGDSYINHTNKLIVFNRLFNGNLEEVRKIKLEKILDKVAYIDYQYYYGSSTIIKEIEKEITTITLKADKLKEMIESIKLIISVYENQIINHWKKIIRDIEIPFYIFSGRIIQNYQRGCGLFIYENESFGQKSIRFVSDMKSDHDAINYLSSGQLSGLVISFTLALNKVYGKDSVDLLLIDDPVQTMDEINIASLIELLRNEFREKQIFLSTHEEDVSRYIRYKFLKYGLNTVRINLKNELYTNLLSN